MVISCQNFSSELQRHKYNYLLDSSICMSQRHFILNVAKAHFDFFSSMLVPPFGFPDLVNDIDIDVICHDENMAPSWTPLCPSPWTSDWSLQYPGVLRNHTLFISLSVSVICSCVTKLSNLKQQMFISSFSLGEGLRAAYLGPPCLPQYFRVSTVAADNSRPNWRKIHFQVHSHGYC